MKIKNTVAMLVLLLLIFLFAHTTVMAITFPPLPETGASLESDEEATMREDVVRALYYLSRTQQNSVRP